MKTTCISAKVVRFVAAGVSAAFLTSMTETALAQPYSPTWASVDKHPPAPEWFQDAGFVIDSGGNVPAGSDASESLYDRSTNRQWRLTKVN